jgi:hypothetical protein
MNAVEQRMFYLMLSPVEGQSFAHSMGFPPPSEEVQEIEIMDVLSRWLVAQKSGTLDEIRESSTWFVDFLAKTDRLVSPSDDLESALTVFSLSMLNKLLDKGFIGLIMDEEALEDIGNE